MITLTKRLAATAAVAVALFSAVGCSSSDASGDTVKIAGGDQIGAAQFPVAQAEGLWAAEGLTAQTQSFTSGRDALNSLIGGQSEFATIGDLPTVSAILGGKDVRVVAALTWGTQWRVLTTTTSGIAKFSDLRGKRIGVTEGTNTQYLLSRILADNGLTEDDVTIVNLAPNQVPVALAGGDIDAGVTFPSFNEAAHKALGDRYREIIFDGYQSPTVLLARGGVAQDRISKVLKVLVEAQKKIDADPDAAKKAVVAQSNGSLSESAADALWPLYKIQLGLDDHLNTALTDEAKWAIGALNLKTDKTPDAIRAAIDPEPLRAVAPALVTLN